MTSIALNEKPETENPHMWFNLGMLDKWPLVVAVTLCLWLWPSSAVAMSMSELRAAINAAEEGSVVYLTGDVDCDAELSVSKKVTISSPDGMRYVFRRLSGYGTGRILTLDALSDVTLRNVIIDGNKDVGSCSDHLVYVSAGRLTLSEGVLVCNATVNAGGTVRIENGATLVMESGSELRGLESTTYGAAVAVKGSESVLLMNGGSIVDNCCSGAYGGAIYLWDGCLTMRGGEIANNTASRAPAGIVTYNSSRFCLSGASYVTNNVGVGGNNFDSYTKVRLNGDYSGALGIGRATEPSPGGYETSVYVDVAGLVIKGPGNIFWEGNPRWIMDLDALAQNWYPMWAKASLRVGDRFFALTLDEAVAYKNPGEKVGLLADWTVSGTIRLSEGEVTLTSGEGGPYRIKRGRSDSLFSVNGALLILENIRVDGGADLSCVGGSVFEFGENGKVVLDDGCVVENMKGGGSCIALLSAAGSSLRMRSGSVIRDCTDTGSYAALVRVLAGSNPMSLPSFEMEGGRITNCTSSASSDPISGWGGMIYVQGGRFAMSGGSISGNTCEKSNAGVLVYQGEAVFSGSAVIRDNPGYRSDLFVCTGGRASVTGDFRGDIVVTSSSFAGEDGNTYVEVAEGATGVWRFRPTFATCSFVGKAVDGYVKCGVPIGGIGSENVATVLDALLLAEEEIEVGIAADLPRECRGAVLVADTLTPLAFDPEALVAEASLPLTFWTAAEGAGFTGTHAFSFANPAIAADGRWNDGRWRVRKVYGENGVTAYRLDYRKDSGMILSIR